MSTSYIHKHIHTAAYNVLDTSTTASSTPIKLPSILILVPLLLFFLVFLPPLSKVLVKLDLLLLRLWCSPALSTLLVEIGLTFVGNSTDGESLVAILAFARWGEEVFVLTWGEVAT